MKRIFIMLSLMCYLQSCGHMQSNHQVPAANPDLLVTGYSTPNTDQFVSLLYRDQVVQNIPIPTSEDKEYAKYLSEEIQVRSKRFIGQLEDSLTIEAARVYGNLVLLDISPIFSHRHYHLVYDVDKNAVVGYFIWYI